MLNKFKNKTLSVILLSYNSRNNLRAVYDELKKELNAEKINYELIIMDDCSDDDSYEIAKDLSIQDEKVKSFQLSKNYTSHYSIFAGLTKAEGDCAVVIPDDFQVPIESVIEMYKLWKEGESIVIPYRESRDDNFLSKLFSRLYYKIMNLYSDVQFPQGGADTFLIDREIIDIINTHISPRNTSSIVEVLKLGFNPKYLGIFRGKSRNTLSRWTFKKKMRLAIDTFISSSSAPIKLISLLGVLSFFTSIGLIIFWTYSKLAGNIIVPGWTLLVILISAFSGLILISLGIIAEYLWRIFDEVKGNPAYIIKDSKE